MSLTALQIKNIVCPDGRKQIKLSDGNSLYLLVKITGSKYWRLRYRYSGKYQELALGTYPQIPLSEARKMADAARAQLVQGVNPTEERKNKKRLEKSTDRKFKVIALKWWEQQSSSWTEENAKEIKRWIEDDMKIIGDLPVDQIDEAHIRDVMLAVESSSHPSASSPILSNITRIFVILFGIGSKVAIAINTLTNMPTCNPLTAKRCAVPVAVKLDFTMRLSEFLSANRTDANSKDSRLGRELVIVFRDSDRTGASKCSPDILNKSIG